MTEKDNNEEIPETPEAAEQTPEQIAEQAKNDYLYLRAEFDNFRKQAIKERSDLVKYGSERIIVELLGVLDIFEKALESDVNESNFMSFKEGMDMTAKELMNVLGKFGVAKNDPVGEPFDPTLHEALSSEPTDEMDEGHVLKCFKPAYKLHDKVIRPAQVIVAGKPAPQGDNS